MAERVGVRMLQEAYRIAVGSAKTLYIHARWGTIAGKLLEIETGRPAAASDSIMYCTSIFQYLSQQSSY